MRFITNSRRFSSTVSGMASTTSNFSRAVVAAMRKIYPEELADKSFDNTGLLLEAPLNAQSKLKNKVLLTIDLTRAVADEAIGTKASVIVAYHPIIFRGLKSLTLANSQQSSLLRLAAAGISVYCPHTAVDSAPGGNADWLADIVSSKWSRQSTSSTGKPVQVSNSPYTLVPFPSAASRLNIDRVKIDTVEHSRHVIVPNTTRPDAGTGRIVRFQQPQQLVDILHELATYFHSPAAFSVAVPQGTDYTNIQVSSIAICAGSGGSVFSGVDEVDMLFTGELSHHEALAAIESGKCVICLNHSNSERGYLNAVMSQRLAEGLSQTDFKEDFSIEVSDRDRDPFQSYVRG